jgi:hypothetical protein
LPLPAPERILIQPSGLPAVQEHDAGAVTAIVLVPPAPAIEALDGASE